MRDKVHCDTHGDTEQIFVCEHLVGESVALGFNRDEPSDENPFPDAWCDDCDIIYRAHNGWTEESEKLVKISLLCSGCYQRACVRNTRPTVTLDDLAGLRWKCGSCEEWHTGPCLDFGYSAPCYWTEEHEETERRERLLPSWRAKASSTFLNDDYCAIGGRDFFVRGVIHLPIIGTAETFRWGVWGSLSKTNFETLLRMDQDPKRIELPAMFSWLSSDIPEYPDTLNVKMYLHVQKPGQRPTFEVEASVHPLAQQYHKGISPERVKEIMMARLREND